MTCSYIVVDMSPKAAKRQFTKKLENSKKGVNFCNFDFHFLHISTTVRHDILPDHQVSDFLEVLLSI